MMFSSNSPSITYRGKNISCHTSAVYHTTSNIIKTSVPNVSRNNVLQNEVERIREQDKIIAQTIPSTEDEKIITASVPAGNSMVKAVYVATQPESHYVTIQETVTYNVVVVNAGNEVLKSANVLLQTDPNFSMIENSFRLNNRECGEIKETLGTRVQLGNMMPNTFCIITFQMKLSAKPSFSHLLTSSYLYYKLDSQTIVEDWSYTWSHNQLLWEEIEQATVL